MLFFSTCVICPIFSSSVICASRFSTRVSMSCEASLDKSSPGVEVDITVVSVASVVRAEGERSAPHADRITDMRSTRETNRFMPQLCRLEVLVLDEHIDPLADH